jgi:hypothetical protein
MAKTLSSREAFHPDLVTLEEQSVIESNGQPYCDWIFLGQNYERCRSVRLSELRSPQATTGHISQKYHGSLVSLYMNSGYLHVTDPRDRVYGMLGIATDCTLDDEVTVNYLLSVSEVYGQVFSHFIQVYDNLSFLCCAAVAPARQEESCTWLPHPQARGSSFNLFVHTKGAGGSISVHLVSTVWKTTQIQRKGPSWCIGNSSWPAGAATTMLFPKISHFWLRIYSTLS